MMRAQELGQPARGKFPHSAEQEAQLIEQLCLGNMDAFEGFYVEIRPRLRRFILAIVRNDQAADEVFNDVMMVVWRKIKDFEGRSRLSTWVHAIAYRRAMKENGKLVALEASNDIEDDIEAVEDSSVGYGAIRTKNLIQGALDQLPADQGTVVRLAYFEGLSYREIGTVMDCPVDTVKTRMFHARRKLKAALGGTMADWA